LDIPDLTGPLKLTNSNVSIHIRRGTLGAYVLGPIRADGHLTVKFAGRSDADLAGGLRQHTDKYDAFGFVRADSPQQAFDMECRLYHHFEPADNAAHRIGRPKAIGNARSARRSANARSSWSRSA
jgi:hypothetical protein